jgi:hypothetical protein
LKKNKLAAIFCISLAVCSCSASVPSLNTEASLSNLNTAQVGAAEKTASSANNLPETLTVETAEETNNKKISFQGLFFGEDPETVKQKLKKYSFLRQDSSSLYFKGTIGDEPADIIAIFTAQTKKLWKVGCVLETDKTFYGMESKWKRYCSVLNNKYGQPSKSIETFSTPYERGDGYEATAIAVGKGFFMSFWELEGGTVVCRISKTKHIFIEYESTNLSAIDEEEKKSSASADL